MLAWLEVENVRNLARQRIELTSGLVVVSGANAQGKSSLLEAVYILATTRSYRTRETREAIAHGADFLRVAGGPSAGPERATALGKKRGERVLSVAQSPAKLAEYLGLLPTLALAGESTRSIVGSPAERRRFMDRATAAADPTHLVDLGEARRALLHRNQLLRAGAPDALLEPWDEVFARAGEKVAERRKRQTEAWQRRLGRFNDVFPEGDAATLVYCEAGDGASLRERLTRSRGSDRREGATLVGPHRDDLALTVGGRNLLRYGSAGQVRSALAALTLAQVEQVAESRGGQRPLLLLDDADTDLDRGRLEAFLVAAAAGGQVIAASSKPELGPLGRGLPLIVEAGVVRPRSA